MKSKLASLALSVGLSALPACTATIARDSGSDTGPSAPLGPGGGAVAGSATSCGSAAPLAFQAMPRLNRAEYDNTVRDLLGDTSSPAAAFPPDDGAESFTNNAEALSISPLLFERYQAAAQALAAHALSGPARPSILVCDPGSSSELACASEILGKLGARAWRRPLLPAEVSQLASLVMVATGQGDSFERGVQLGLEAILLSPHFLFRPELDADPASLDPHPLGSYELASRLSYFLWSSMPDDSLVALADGGSLSDPGVLAQTAERMLEDPRAQALVQNFAREWLTSSFANAVPAAEVYPDFDAELRDAMQGETSLFMGSLLLGPASLLDLLDANYTFVNERLARHYGISGVTGSTFQRVSLEGTHRAGLLTQGAVLTMTSVATRSSPVRRGEWVLAQLLCSPPPPPPANVPALPPPTMTTGTMRERLEQHRKSPECAACHALMDPLGLALEHFDGVGAWRESDGGLPLDTTGALPDGTTFDGATELGAALKKDVAFSSCATQKLFGYGLGRVPGEADQCRLQSLRQRFEQQGYSSRQLILAIVSDDSFRMRRGGQ